MDTDTFEKFEQSMLDFGAIQYDGLADDDDPLGHCLVIGQDDKMTMIAIDGGMLAPENLKSLILGICATIVEEKATRIGWLLPAYKIANIEPGDPPPAANFADDDRAVEVFRCMTVEADRVSEYEAPILRNPSRLGPWEPKEVTRNPYVLIPQRALSIVAEEGGGSR